MTGVYVATEDALSEAVAERLIQEENHGLYVTVRVGPKGERLPPEEYFRHLRK